MICMLLIEINGKRVELRIDTGVKCNVITLDLFTKLSHGNKSLKGGAIGCLWW